jgi:divalent metal cation (Fe/Co/Zn/Cd) transporter
LRLSIVSIVWGVGSGVWAITASLGSHSLSVLGLGLNLAADVTGSVFVAWRLRGELHGRHEGERAERVASFAVASALFLLALFLAVEALIHLHSHDLPRPGIATLAAAGASLVVLTPLGLAKRRVGAALPSPALRGDGSLSLIGATVAGLAFLGLLTDRVLGWWWADAVAALIVAAIATFESSRTLRSRHP